MIGENLNDKSDFQYILIIEIFMNEQSLADSLSAKWVLLWNKIDLQSPIWVMHCLPITIESQLFQFDKGRLVCFAEPLSDNNWDLNPVIEILNINNLDDTLVPR